MSNLSEILYEYQKEDAQKMIEDPKLMNGSEMGTGKTEIAIKVLQETNGPRNLIVCPGGMTLEWAERLRKYGEDCIALPESSGFKLTSDSFKHKYLVVNYEMLRVPNKRKKKRRQTDYLSILEIPPWDSIFYDEAHRLKNPDAAQTRGARILSQKSERVHPMSGSMFLNWPHELWSNLDMLHPDEFGDYWNFANEYCIVRPSRWGMQVVAVRKKKQSELRSLMSNYMIRRERQDVLPWLPAKTYREIPLRMHSKVRTAYDELEEELFTRLDSGESIWAKGSFSLLMKLRQLSLDPKLLGLDEPSIITQNLLEIVDDITNSGKKVAVFSWFSSYLVIVKSLLEKMNKKVEICTGLERDPSIRLATRKRFQEGDSQIFLGSIGTMEGIDLFATDIGIFTDRDWVPLKNRQAEDRLPRPGQESDNVLIIDLTVQDSIYDSIQNSVGRKEEAFTETIAVERVIKHMQQRRK